MIAERFRFLRGPEVDVALPFGWKFPALPLNSMATARAAVSAIALESAPAVAEKFAQAHMLFGELKGLPQKPFRDWSLSLGPAGTAKLLRAINVWPPFAGAGIRVTEVAADLSHIRVQMGLYPWNRNWVGTQFGGSLFSR